MNHPSGIPSKYARELLLTESNVFRAFDSLAEKINHYIDYPSMLAENGVQGTAVLELYFDHEGHVDEVKSKFFGGHRMLRGLLVRAARRGLVKWYLSDAIRLRKDQFKNQYFRAEFSISHILRPDSRIEKIDSGSYAFLRRRQVRSCAHPTGVDLACSAVKAYGVIRRQWSDDYRAQYQGLRERLEHLDRIGLSGIAAMVSAGAS